MSAERHGRLRARPERRLLEPEVLRLPEARAARLAARGARPDRRDRHLAPPDRRRTSAGATLADEPLGASVSDGRAALDVPGRLAPLPLRRLARARRRPPRRPRRRPLRRPCVVTPEVLAELRALVPLAPLHQPYNLAAIEAVAERLPDVPQVACFDTSFHRGQPAVAELVPLPKAIRDAGVQRYGFHGLSYEYIASVLPEVAPEIARRPRDRRPPRQRRQPLRPAERGRASTARSASPRSTGSAWARGRASLDPGVILHLFQTLGLSARRGGDDPLQEVGPARHFRHQQRHARPAREAPSRRARLAVDYFVYQRGQADRRAGRRAGRDRRAGLHRRHRRALGRDPPPDLRGLAWLGVDARPGGERGARAADLHGRAAASRPGSIPTNEELMIARHTGALLGISGAPRGARHGSLTMTSRPHEQPRPPQPGSPWEGFRAGLWQKEIDVRDFIQQNYTPYEGDESFLAPATDAHAEDLGQADGALRRGAQEGRPRRLPDPQLDHRPRPRLHRPRERGHRRPADRRAAEARHHAQRRLPHGRSARSKTYGYEPDPHVVEAFTKYRKTHNEGVFDAYTAGHPALPQLARPDRPARRLRPRPHHRRLPARRALRRRPADRAQAAGEGRPRRRAVHRGDHPRPRGARPSRSARSRS